MIESPRVLSGHLPLLAGLLLATFSAEALAPLSGEELVGACRAYLDEASDLDETSDGEVCETYVRGYIAGAERATIGAPRNGSTFFQRALRTRANRHAEENISLRYCIPRNESMQGLAEKIIAANADLEAKANAGDVIQSVLEQHFPCDGR